MELIFKNISEDNFLDIYFTYRYGKACEFSDNASWEICLYHDLKYVYLKRPYIFEGITYYDLITPYGYSGFHYLHEKTLQNFIPIFRKEALKRNYITEVVRQNPYISMNNLPYYNTILSKTCFGVTLDKFENLQQYLSQSHKNHRKSYHKAVRNNLSFSWESINEVNLENFKKIYHETMRHLKSDKYYFFNKNYYSVLLNELKEYVFIANVKKDNKLIASCMIFKFNKYLHYHLGGSLQEYRNLCPNNFLHSEVINYGILHQMKLYILGCGIRDYDCLFDFKNKIANVKYKYTIYKNILNPDIYHQISINYSKNNKDIDLLYFPLYRYKLVNK